MEDERIKAVKNWPEPKSVYDIQVFLGFANFYWYFIQGFYKIAKPLTSILRTSSLTTLSTILQSIDVGDEDEVGWGESGIDDINLLNPLASKRSIEPDYLTFKGTKKSDDNTKKGVRAARNSDYLTLAAKKAFNNLYHTFI